MVRKFIYNLVALIGISMMTSCQDDAIVSGDGNIPEGMATISAEVSFKSFGSALNGDSRTLGDAIKDINSLYVLLYDKDGNYVEMFDATQADNYTEPEPDEQRNNLLTADGEHIAESATPCAKFKKTIPYGEYKIYAVANVDLENKDYAEAIKTEVGLKSISFQWNSKDIDANNQMFGFFTTEKSTTKPDKFEADIITISSPVVSLHAWIRRLASKVTVAYDGSELNENVYIYLKSVQIKDIPKNCYLGKQSPASPDEEIELLEGDKLIYTEKTGMSGPYITKGIPYYYWNAPDASVRMNWTDEDLKTAKNNAHKEDQEALFFYENMQGTGDDKRQDSDANGVLDNPGHSDPTKWNDVDKEMYEKYGDKYKYKDGKSYGTYIEVKAYYQNDGLNASAGEITYRFMLGKNVLTDYNAERNYHYKLTLQFKGDANDVDWHIEYYEPEPSLFAPEKVYISYLYNQEMTLPIKVNGNVVNLKAEIVENNWWPEGAYTALFNGAPTNELWNGFLSLTKSNDVIVGKGVKATDSQYGSQNRDGYNGMDYYNNGRDERIYYPDEGNDDNTEIKGKYSVSKDVNKVGGMTFNIPLFTRAKQLTSTTAYSGNNYFVEYPRMAKVKITASFDKNGDGEMDETLTQNVLVEQVKRLVNPTGIWRSSLTSMNDPTFYVALMEQNGSKDANFSVIQSDGPWRAVILSETVSGLIDLEPDYRYYTQNAVTEKSTNVIEGATDTEIRFIYTPKKGNACGIIKVEYNNYTCIHYIFVRVGYEPLDMGNGTKWYSYNLYDKDNLTDSPLEEGSYFKSGNVEDAILASNNDQSGKTFNVDTRNQSFLLANGSSKKWNSIKPVAGDDRQDFSNWQLDNKAKVASFDDWSYLKNNCDHGYGVLYGDGATEPQSSPQNAYGYRKQGNDAYGMRGCFVYKKENGENLFFPIGAAGYGRRLAEYNAYNNLGVLRYGGVASKISGNARPLLWYLYENEGAIYWCMKPENKKNSNVNDEYYAYEYVIKNNTTNYKAGTLNHSAWDINYRVLDFNTFKSDAWPDEIYAQSKNEGNDGGYKGKSGSDACFIRLVEK